MAQVTQAATIQSATILPKEVFNTDQKLRNDDYPMEESSEIHVETIPEDDSSIRVPEQKQISNEVNCTQVVGEPELLYFGENPSMCATDEETISNPTFPLAQNLVDSTLNQVPGNINVFGYSNYGTNSFPGVDTMRMNTMPQAFNSVYVRYTSSTLPPQMYHPNDLSYPMYVVGTPRHVHTPPSKPYYFDNSTSSVFNAVANIPPPDTDTGPTQSWNCDSIPIPASALDADPYTGPDVDQDADDNTTAQRLGRQSTVQWLLKNYETAEGESLRRSTLYNHYLRHCREKHIDSVNAASFGKLIRSVFLGLRTRRLGTRGNSKYHYYGIRIKPGSKLRYVPDTEDHIPVQKLSTKKFQKSRKHKRPSEDYNLTLTKLDQCDVEPNTQVICKPLRRPIHHEYLDEKADTIPDLPPIDWPSECTLPTCCCKEDIDLLCDTYRKHCEEVRKAVVHLDFRTLELVWRKFWKIRDNINEKRGNRKRFSAIKMYVLCTCSSVQQFIRNADYLFYEYLVDVIVRDVMHPMPRSLIRSVRSFASKLTSLLKPILVAWPQELIKIKVTALNAFSRTLYRYTSLNHIAQSVGATIENQSNIQQMIFDLNNVEFCDIRERTFWICNGESEVLNLFSLTLQNQPPSSLEECINNLTNFVTRMLKPHEGRNDFEKISRQFLLQWSYYSSLFLSYLTIQNASSFGSFHLLRLFYDEYVYYLVVHYVSREIGETTVSIIGDNYDKKFHGIDENYFFQDFVGMEDI